MKKKWKITKEQIVHILGKDWPEFEEKILGGNCFCQKCGGGVGIVDWEVELNDLNDAIFRGKCSKCGSPMNRYAEIGEVGKYRKRIEEVNKIAG